MFAAKSLVRAAAPLAKTASQSRQMTVVASYPMVRISFTEKLIHGLIMAGSYCAIPMWVLYHIRSYRGQTK